MRAVAVAGVAVWLAGPALADGLALRRVMLSSAGTGYFEYEAVVDGTAALPLAVRLGDVDDVLKSLVVFDAAGAVGAVTLPGRDESHQAFGRVPFTADSLRSPVDYLNSLQGMEVAVAGPRPMQGRILWAEAVHEPGEGRTERVLTRVSLLTEAGLRQFVLEDSEAVQVVDAGLRERIGQAVAATRQEAGRDARTLQIASVGPAGPRTVRVSYVAVAPLWKATYRLVLPSAEAGEQARLQGWATLENDTGADWAGVSLALQYGNPVTFHQAIYRSYFVQRPEVPVEVLGRLLPDVDTRARTVARAAATPAAPMAPAPVAAPKAAPMAAAETGEVAEAGSETVFTLTQPIDVAAGFSATVPILDVSLPAGRVALATPGREHPLEAIRIGNTSGSSLPAGALTIYDLAAAAPYAGDARLGGLPTGESRLIAYAQDLRTSIDWHEEAARSVASLTVANGVLEATERMRRVTRAAVSAPAGAARRVLIEVAKPAGGSVASGFAQPAEETATAWRFALEVPAGAVREITYAVDEDETRTVALTGDWEAVVAVLSLPGASPAARAAFERVARLRAEVAREQGLRDMWAGERAKVEADEARVRDNLRALQPGDALRTRLLQQLDADETHLAELGDSLRKADIAAVQAQTALSDAVAGLRLP